METRRAEESGLETSRVSTASRRRFDSLFSKVEIPRFKKGGTSRPSLPIVKKGGCRPGSSKRQLIIVSSLLCINFFSSLITKRHIKSVKRIENRCVLPTLEIRGIFRKKKFKISMEGFSSKLNQEISVRNPPVYEKFLIKGGVDPDAVGERRFGGVALGWLYFERGE